jgi:hypothetical protein
VSLDKAIKHGKEYRRPHYGAKSFDRSCHSNGGCPVCEGNRMHRDRVREEDAEGQVREWEEDERGAGARQGETVQEGGGGE